MIKLLLALVICSHAFTFTVSPAGKTVLPGVPITIQVVLPTQDNSLQKFVFTGDSEIWDNLNLEKITSTTFGTNNANTPLVPGVHTLSWTSKHSGQTADYSITLKVEVSCSDGNICNGEERFVSGKCEKAAYNLCDDLDECTLDFCSAEGFCTHTMNPAFTADQCPPCIEQRCRPNCRGKLCGDDGCGGTCGTPCTDDAICVAGSCQVVNSEGTCARPISLTEEAVALNWNGRIAVNGDTSKGVNAIYPICNRQSTAQEIVYELHNTFGGGVGMEARVEGFGGPESLDTVIQVIEIPSDYQPSVSAGCQLAGSSPTNILVPACSDDSSPPGGLASRISWQLKDGYYYYVVVDGYSAAQVGPYNLTVTLSNLGCTLSCDGKYCGSASCGTFTCGDCEEGFVCSTSTSRCVPFPCVPNCKKGRHCGDDGCGGSCGTCRSGTVCNIDTGKCQKDKPCNHFVPICRNGIHGSIGCPAGQFCGSDCACHKVDAPMMDLVLDAAAVQPYITMFNVLEGSCSVAEGCIDAFGMRKIVRFSTNVANQGTAPFTPSNPPANFPELYEWGSCHGHWHFTGFAAFELVEKDTGNTVVKGRKQSYCAEDSYRYQSGSHVNCFATSDCSNQGLSIGWIDVYGPDLDCQFLDITGVPAGDYFIKQCTNQRRSFPELSFENNCITVPFTIPEENTKK